MQTHTTLAGVLVLLMLGLNSIACWAMVWQQDLGLFLVCLALSLGLLCEGYQRWRRNHKSRLCTKHR
jgi:hypothetical protein